MDIMICSSYVCFFILQPFFNSFVRMFWVVRQSDETMIEYRPSARRNYKTSNGVSASGLIYYIWFYLVLRTTFTLKNRQKTIW